MFKPQDATFSVWLNHFLKLVSLANLIVLPAVYFIVDSWLNNLAFYVPVGCVMLLITPVVLLVSPFATVDVQSVIPDRLIQYSH